MAPATTAQWDVDPNSRHINIHHSVYFHQYVIGHLHDALVQFFLFKTAQRKILLVKPLVAPATFDLRWPYYQDQDVILPL